MISDFKNRRPLSVIRLQEEEYGCILCGNKCIPIFCGTSQWHTNNNSFCAFFEWKLAGNELLCTITNASLKDMGIFCILLPKWNELGLPLISDNNDEPACCTLIDSSWHTMQQGKAFHFQNFLEDHMMITFLRATMIRWKDQMDMILMYCLLCIHSNMLLMQLMMIHNIWLYCCYAPFITVVYWWYLAQHYLVSNCNTGWTHLYRTHHDHHAEWFIRSSCFHYYTLNVQWYYLQAMCWGIYLYYHLLMKTSPYVRFWPVGP